MLTVKQIGHACFYFGFNGFHIYTDYWVENTMMGVCRRFPDPGNLQFDLPKPDLVLLSHHHWDHIIPKSLLRLSKDTPIWHPKNFQISLVLEKLGFTNVKIIEGWEAYFAGGVTIIPTLSRVPFGEVGFLFLCEDGTAWDLVDTVFNEEDVTRVNDLCAGELDLCFAPYQSYDEMAVFMRMNSEAQSMVSQKNAKSLSGLKCKLVVPAADGLYYAGSKYMNKKSFLNHPFDFIDQIVELNPQQKCMISVSMDEFFLKNGELSWRRPIGISAGEILKIYDQYRSFDAGYPHEEGDFEAVRELSFEEKIQIEDLMKNFFKNYNQEALEIFSRMKMVWRLEVWGSELQYTVDFLAEKIELGEERLANCWLKIPSGHLIDLLCYRNLLGILLQSGQLIGGGLTMELGYKSLDALWYGGFSDQERLSGWLDFLQSESVLGSV